MHPLFFISIFLFCYILIGAISCVFLITLMKMFFYKGPQNIGFSDKCLFNLRATYNDIRYDIDETGWFFVSLLIWPIIYPLSAIYFLGSVTIRYVLRKINEKLKRIDEEIKKNEEEEEEIVYVVFDGEFSFKYADKEHLKVGWHKTPMSVKKSERDVEEDSIKVKSHNSM